jgi:hypothetical protein
MGLLSSQQGRSRILIGLSGPSPGAQRYQPVLHSRGICQATLLGCLGSVPTGLRPGPARLCWEPQVLGQWQ